MNNETDTFHLHLLWVLIVFYLSNFNSTSCAFIAIMRTEENFTYGWMFIFLLLLIAMLDVTHFFKKQWLTKMHVSEWNSLTFVNFKSNEFSASTKDFWWYLHPWRERKSLSELSCFDLCLLSINFYRFLILIEIQWIFHLWNRKQCIHKMTQSDAVVTIREF